MDKLLLLYMYYLARIISVPIIADITKEMLQYLNLSSLTQVTLEEYMVREGFQKLFLDELITSVNR